ncbi:MAG TPA: HD-GYP domain-containing protein [Bacillales bacterium]|nr:HD-GYP domain-containing protein [Bacillales bacterium]
MSELQQLRNKVRRLSSLLEASKDFNSTIDIEKVLGRILRQMIRVIEAEAGTLWLFNKEEELIQAKVAEGPSKDSILNIELQAGEGIVGKVILTGKPHFVEDVRTDPKWAWRVDHESGFVTRSMLTIPLLVKGGAIGALQLLNKKGGRLFDEDDLELALSLAQQSALALHNSQMYDELSRMAMSTIRTLTKAVDARDPYTSGHSERVARYTRWIAEQLGMDKEECIELERAALLHDVGKIGIPDQILAKPGRLTKEEFATIKKHPEIGAEILADMEPKHRMKLAVRVARSHHERLDGSGYPDGLRGDEIPLDVRIAAVADSFDAMTTDRPYSSGRNFREGLNELIRCKETLFDSAVVEAFASVLQNKTDETGRDV